MLAPWLGLAAPERVAVVSVTPAAGSVVTVGAPGVVKVSTAPKAVPQAFSAMAQ